MNTSIATTGFAGALATAAAAYLATHGVPVTPETLLGFGASAWAFVSAIHWGHAKLSPKTATPAAVTKAIAAQPAEVQAAIAVQTVASPAVPPAASVIVCALILAGMLALVTLPGCATPPSVQQESAVTVAVDIAAGFAIQRGTDDPAVWKARAVKFKAIAVTLQGVNDAGNATLATLAADLQPLVAKLGPADVLAANALVAALQPYLTQQQTANATVANTQAQVALILTAVVNACTAYGA